MHRHCVQLVPAAAVARSAGLLFAKKVAPPSRPVDPETRKSIQAFAQRMRQARRPGVHLNTTLVDEDHHRRANISLERLEQLRNLYVVLPHRRPSNDIAFSGRAHKGARGATDATVRCNGG